MTISLRLAYDISPLLAGFIDAAAISRRRSRLHLKLFRIH